MFNEIENRIYIFYLLAKNGLYIYLHSDGYINTQNILHIIDKTHFIVKTVYEI